MIKTPHTNEFMNGIAFTIDAFNIVNNNNAFSNLLAML
jgi:hypothetical protein